MDEQRRRNSRWKFTTFLLAVAVIAMTIDFEWLCYTRPNIRQPDLGRVYPIICRKGGPPAWLNEDEHFQLNAVSTVGIVCFGILGYRLIRRYPKLWRPEHE
jgi:hypothetical protein